MTGLANFRTETSTQDRARSGKLTNVVELIRLGAAWRPAFADAEERFRRIAGKCIDQDGTGNQCLAVTSSVAGEGKSTVALGLAFAAAENLGGQVLLVETDMQRPHLAEDLLVDGSVGLSQYLYGEVELEAVLKPTRIPNVSLLPAGQAVGNPGPLVRSAHFRSLMRGLSDDYATVILDVPPMLTSPHAAVITSQAESVVLVARAGRTHSDDVRNSVKTIGEDRVRGVVLNGTRASLPRWFTRLFGLAPLSVE